MGRILDYSERACSTCGKAFKPHSSAEKYCSIECKRGKAVCRQCGKAFLRTPGTTGQFCSRECWYAAPGKKERPEQACVVCRTLFHPTGPDQKCCSRDCADKSRRTQPHRTHCEQCGNPLREDADARVRFCSKSCALKNRPGRGKEHALGVTKPGPNGYQLVKVGVGYPGAFKNGWMLQHRQVMEEIIGRPVYSWETVHHKNGIRDDNRPENLELWLSKDPPGQRVDDLLDWVTEHYETELIGRLVARGKLVL